MLILGIDPGTRVLGYGLVNKTPRGIVYVDHGHLKAAEKLNAEVMQQIESIVQSKPVLPEY